MSDVKKVEERELTYVERATWGECPVCHALHGSWCNGHGSPCLGQTVGGGPPADGVHLGRLQEAPTIVRIEWR